MRMYTYVHIYLYIYICYIYIYLLNYLRIYNVEDGIKLYNM